MGYSKTHKFKKFSCFWQCSFFVTLVMKNGKSLIIHKKLKPLKCFFNFVCRFERNIVFVCYYIYVTRLHF